MKAKILLSAVIASALSASAFAATPASYDTKFNVSANVPDSAMITDPSGKPVTDLDVELIPAASGKMEAETQLLKLWNNDVTGTDVSLTMDDSQSATGDAFTLYSTQGGSLHSLTYQISTISESGTQSFATSGDTMDYALTANGTHAELPVVFKFVSDADYNTLGQGHYTGVVYANVVANP